MASSIPTSSIHVRAPDGCILQNHELDPFRAATVSLQGPPRPGSESVYTRDLVVLRGPANSYRVLCCGQADVLPLARVPGVLPFRARRLFDANIRTRVQLATTTEDDFVSNILEVVSLPLRLLSVPRGDLCYLPAIPGEGRGCIRRQFSCEHVSRCP